MDGSLELHGVARAMSWRAAQSLVLALAGGVLVTTAFGWDPLRTAASAAVGILVWGTLEFVDSVRDKVPRGDLPTVPAGAMIRESRAPVSRRGLVMLALVIAALVPLAWLADRWELGGVFIPGQFAGYAAARAVGFLLVRRWEKSHRRRVLAPNDLDDEAVLYAS